MKCGRHAVSIDERRSKFRPNLWTNLDLNSEDGRDIQQVWFAGVHSDVGGSYTDSGLSDIALNWVLDGAIKHGMLPDKERIDDLELNPLPLGKIHNSLIPWWWILGWKTREVPDGAWIYTSVKKRIEHSRNTSNMQSYEPPLPSNVKYVS